MVQAPVQPEQHREREAALDETPVNCTRRVDEVLMPSASFMIREMS